MVAVTKRDAAPTRSGAGSSAGVRPQQRAHTPRTANRRAAPDADAPGAAAGQGAAKVDRAPAARDSSGAGRPSGAGRSSSVGRPSGAGRSSSAAAGRGRLGAVTVRAGSADLGRGGVAEIQRARILAALVEVSQERGASDLTVAHIVARSGVSRRTFYEMFEDRNACFLAAFHDAVQRAAARVEPAFRNGDPVSTGTRAGVPLRAWREQVRAGLLALLEFLDDEPALGGLCVVDALGAAPAALEQRSQVLERLIDAVDEGRAEARAGLSPSRLTAEGVVGGVLAVIYTRLAAGRPAQGSDSSASGSPRSSARSAAAGPLVGLLNALMGMIVLPYEGPAAAAREASRPAPRARPRPVRARSNPLEGLEMRLTYRTVQVLDAIATLPGASNRQVAAAAGVADQGQISKLLARLKHVGLVRNDGVGPARGEPNAWRLTARGEEVHRAISEQSAATDG
jgi:AcrR family transcriptional regulator